MGIDNIKQQAQALFSSLNHNNTDSVIDAKDKTNENIDILKALGVIDENGNAKSSLTLEYIEENFEDIEQKINNIKAAKPTGTKPDLELSDSGTEQPNPPQGDTEAKFDPNNKESAKTIDSDNENNPDPPKGDQEAKFGHNNKEWDKTKDGDDENNPDPSKGDKETKFDPSDKESDKTKDRDNDQKIIINGKMHVWKENGDIYNMNGQKVGHKDRPESND